MSQMKSRRELGLLATGGAIAAALVVSAKSASAQPQAQPNMVHAREALEAALQSLRAAADDKGGHRAQAIRLIEGAIGEIDAGIHYSNTH